MSRLVDLRDHSESRLSRPPRRRRAPWRLPPKAGRVVLAAAVAAGVGAAVPHVKRWSETSELLPVERVVVTGADESRVAEVEAYASVPSGAPLFSLDLADVAARVEEHPYVRRATVRWMPPDGLLIRVSERVPVVLVALGGVYAADEEGVLMKRHLPGDALDLPVITGIDEAGEAEASAQVREALVLLSDHESAGSPGGAVHEVHLGAAGTSLTFSGGLVVHLGDKLHRDRLARLKALLAHLEVTGRLKAKGLEPSIIHLDDDRRPERVAVRLRPRAEVPADTGNGSPRERQGRAG